MPAPDTNPDVSVLASAPDLEEWHLDLHAHGARREEAVSRLHGLLLRATRLEVFRRNGSLHQLSTVELDELAQDAADDAAVSVLRRLGDFRGESSVPRARRSTKACARYRSSIPSPERGLRCTRPST